MNAYEAEKAFREQLECETVLPEIGTMEIRKLGVPVGLELERHESQVVLTFLVFKTGVKSVSRYSCEKIAVSARDASPKDEGER